MLAASSHGGFTPATPGFIALVPPLPLPPLRFDLRGGRGPPRQDLAPESALGSRPRVALSSVRSRPVYVNRAAIQLESACRTRQRQAKKEMSLSAPVGRF
jgi:hypothetical protein